MDKGGSSDIVRIICQSLKDEYDVWLIYGRTEDPDDATIEFLNSFEQKINIDTLRRAVNPFYDIIALFQLVFTLKAGRFDIVHTHTSKAGFLGRLAARWCRVPKIIYMPHGNVFYGYFSRLFTWFIIALERFAAHFTDIVFVLLHARSVT